MRNVSDNGGIDQSRSQKALESLLSDDSDDKSIADDTSQNLPSRNWSGEKFEKPAWKARGNGFVLQSFKV